MKRMVSGIQSSGMLTLGNYIGAMQHFVKYQEDYEMYIFIANLHSITVSQDPKSLREHTKDVVALYLACGLDTNKTTLFLQSDVPEHSELAWILTCNTYIGELQRMTQFKDKSQKHTNITAGLFTYPALMSADILLYDANYVPVGADQKQHIELTRTIAERFNHKYNDVFVIPEPLIAKSGAKIMSLQTPQKKMSKSDENAKEVIYLLDEPSIARKKIMSAITDSIGIIQYDVENQPGLANLLTIFSELTNRSIDNIVLEFKEQGYGELKKALGEIVFQFLTELQTKYRQIMESGMIEDILKDGAQKAEQIAHKKIRKIKKKVGFQLFN